MFIEGKHAPERRKRFLPRQSDARKAKKAFPERKSGSQRRSSIAKSKTFLPSENNVCNGESASIERKHHNRAKTSLAKTKMCLLSDISARKTRFCICGRRFRSIKSFSHLRVTFSLGYSIFRSVDGFSPVRATFSLSKSVFGFSSNVFARKTRFRSENAY